MLLNDKALGISTYTSKQVQTIGLSKSTTLMDKYLQWAVPFMFLIINTVCLLFGIKKPIDRVEFWQIISKLNTGYIVDQA